MSLRGTKQSRTIQGGFAQPLDFRAIASYLAMTWWSVRWCLTIKFRNPSKTKNGPDKPGRS
jgi:hypothetical protein